MKNRLALGLSIPVVLLFLGLTVALLLPSHYMVLTEALDSLGLLGGRRRIDGLASAAPGPGEPAPLVIRGGTLWDARGGARPNAELPLAGGRIERHAAAGSRTIDATGLTILPGLIDMHIHSLGGAFDGELMIGNGVTSARDLGSDLDAVLERRRATERGERIGPRLFVTGPYLVGGEGASDQEIGARGPEEAVAIVQRAADGGANGAKAHGGIDEATLAAAAKAAHERGLWIAAHLDRVAAVTAARCGVDTIEHGSGLPLPDGDGESSRAQMDAAIEILIARGVAITPTLVAAEHAFTLPALARRADPVMEYFPSLFRRGWISSQMANAGAGSLGPEEERRRREHLARLERFVASFHRAGGHVLAGSDAPALLVAPGFDLHRELELLVEAGLTPDGALRAATSDAAQALGRSADIGALSPGMRADVLIIDGDPFTEGISTTRRIAVVIKDGHVLLDRLATVARRH